MSEVQADKRGTFIVVASVEPTGVTSWSLNVRPARSSPRAPHSSSPHRPSTTLTRSSCSPASSSRAIAASRPFLILAVTTRRAVGLKNLSVKTGVNVITASARKMNLLLPSVNKPSRTTYRRRCPMGRTTRRQCPYPCQRSEPGRASLIPASVALACFPSLSHVSVRISVIVKNVSTYARCFHVPSAVIQSF